jgi:hypothetical protein
MVFLELMSPLTLSNHSSEIKGRLWTSLSVSSHDPWPQQCDTNKMANSASSPMFCVMQNTKFGSV